MEGDQLGGRLVGVGLAPPGQGAQAESRDLQTAATDSALLHGAQLTALGGRSARRPTLARVSRVRLGLNLGYWGMGNDADNLALAREADQLGYAVAWAAEAYGSDAATVLAWVAAQTEQIDIGSAIFQIPARTPAMTAMTAATLDTLSGGRFRLGSACRAAGVRGLARAASPSRWPAPASTSTSSTWPCRRQRVRYDGQTYTLPLPDGPGKALQLTVHPVREHIPIYLAAVGPKNLELAGEIADGWLGLFFAAEHADEQLANAASRAGQGRQDARRFRHRRSPCRSWSATDVAACADPVRPYAALYVGGMGSREQNFYNALAARMGYEAEAAARSRTGTWPATMTAPPRPCR